MQGVRECEVQRVVWSEALPLDRVQRQTTNHPAKSSHAHTLSHTDPFLFRARFLNSFRTTRVARHESPTNSIDPDVPRFAAREVVLDQLPEFGAMVKAEHQDLKPPDLVALDLPQLADSEQDIQAK